MATYAQKADLSGYQPKGNYATLDSLSSMMGQFAPKDALNQFQPKGDYTTRNELNAISSSLIQIPCFGGFIL